MKKDLTPRIAEAGNCGKSVKSDCFIRLELTNKGGQNIELISKVAALYGKQIEERTKEVLTFFGIDHCHCYIEDKGAIDIVITARLEAAIKQLVDSEKMFLPTLLEENHTVTTKDTFRFSRLYLPGNTPKLMLNAGLHKANGLILDLEDAVAYPKKEEARYIVRNMLRGLHFYGCERMVRINQIPLGLEDLKAIVPHNVNLILVPKCEDADQILAINSTIEAVRNEHGGLPHIWLMPIIESALGVINAYSIATAADNVAAMAIGLEDYTADLGCQRTEEGNESFYARCSVVNACKAAGIQAIDSVFSNVADMEALAKNVQRSKALGFDGMGCIHPRQIAVIQQNFAPSTKEITKAQQIVHAFHLAQEKNLGVVSLGNKMIDAPVVKRAEKSVKLALDLGLIEKNWEENSEC